jgi:hypothetical protein
LEINNQDVTKLSSAGVINHVFGDKIHLQNKKNSITYQKFKVVNNEANVLKLDLGKEQDAMIIFSIATNLQNNLKSC